MQLIEISQFHRTPSPTPALLPSQSVPLENMQLIVASQITGESQLA